MGGTTDLDLLSLFTVVVDTHGFSGAAAKLGLPKSSVSRGIVRLEESLGTQLLHRTTRTVGLTTAGAALYERVAPLIRSLRDAAGSLPEQKEEPSGLLRITAPTDLGTTILPDLITSFLRRYPAVSVDAVMTNRVVDMVTEGIDLGLRASGAPLRDSALVARKILSAEMQVFASPAYLARRGTPRTFEDAATHDWVIFRGRIVPNSKLPAEGRIKGDDFFFVRATLRAGAGIGILPPFLASEDVSSGALVRILPNYSEGTSSVYLVYPATKHVPPKTAAFRDYLLEQMAIRPWM